MQTINAPILRAVCEELNVGVGDIIAWEPSKPELHHIDGKTQRRLSLLMDRNNEGQLTDDEARELAELGEYAEKLSLENARILADAAAAAKKRNREQGVAEIATGARRQDRAAAIPSARKSPKTVPA